MVNISFGDEHRCVFLCFRKRFTNSVTIITVLFSFCLTNMSACLWIKNIFYVYPNESCRKRKAKTRNVFTHRQLITIIILNRCIGLTQLCLKSNGSGSKIERERYLKCWPKLIFFAKLRLAILVHGFCTLQTYTAAQF